MRTVRTPVLVIVALLLLVLPVLLTSVLLGLTPNFYAELPESLSLASLVFNKEIVFQSSLLVCVLLCLLFYGYLLLVRRFRLFLLGIPLQIIAFFLALLMSVATLNVVIHDSYSLDSHSYHLVGFYKSSSNLDLLDCVEDICTRYPIDFMDSDGRISDAEFVAFDEFSRSFTVTWIANNQERSADWSLPN